MDTRYIIPLLCTAALAYACGPWMHSQNATSAASTVAQRRHKAQRTVATTLDVVPRGDRIDFALHVANNTAKSVELRFPNGQTHDFVVLDREGHVVWRWSAGRLFTQAMQSKTVKSSDTLTIEDEWDPSNAHGTYVAVATLNTDAHPIERRIAFTLP